VEFSVRHGPVTLLALTHTAPGVLGAPGAPWEAGGAAGLKLLVAEGESLPGPTLAIGNTNSRLRFPLDPGTFVTRWAEAGPPHHCALGTGHQRATIERLARLLDLPLTVVA
jgi:L-arabinose isomerase